MVASPGWEPDHVARKTAVNPVKQRLYRTSLRTHFESSGPLAGRDSAVIDRAAVQTYTYPMEGHPEVKMFYRYGGSFIEP